jgi:hypothetical protein
MSVDIRASRAALGAHESAGLVDTAARLTDLRREATARRRAGAVLAAAIVAVVIAGSAWYAAAHRLTSDRPVEPAQPSVDTTAVRTAEDFLGALQDARTASGPQLDPAVARVFSYLADDALVTEPFGSPQELRWSLAWERATAWREMIEACVQTGSDAAGTIIECPFTFHGIRSEEVGFAPFSGNNWRFRVRDEKITDAQWNFNIDTGFSSQRWEPFERWVSTTYPDDAAVMYDDASHTHSRSTTEAIALWERRTREFAAHEIASREDYRARADAICTSAHARLNAELAAAGMSLQPIPLPHRPGPGPQSRAGLAGLRGVRAGHPRRDRRRAAGGGPSARGPHRLPERLFRPRARSPERTVPTRSRVVGELHRRSGTRSRPEPLHVQHSSIRVSPHAGGL